MPPVYECRAWRMGTLMISLLVLMASLCIPDSAAACPKKCDCRTDGVVNCALANLKNFPEGLPIDLEVLNVADNWIQTLPSLSIYPALRVFNASGNRIAKISADTFQGLTKLNYIDLSANKIAQLSDINGMTSFKSNENLQTLLLSQNLIVSFNSRFPDSLIVSDSLLSLDVSFNKITFLDQKSLTGLPNLINLNISRNPLKWVTGLQSNSLTYLDITKGQMDGLNRNDLDRLPRLETIKISRNPAFNLYFEPVHSRSLTRYEVEFCNLQSPGLQDMPNLQYAFLQGNKIEILRTKAMIYNKRLTVLDLSSNVLKEIEPDSFLGLENIEFLYLGENQIADLFWDMLITNHELKHLNLTKNLISTLPGNLTVSKLAYLGLSQCRIQRLEAHTFTRMPFLATLDLSNNILEEIPNALESNSLKILNLSYNRILSVSNETFHKIPNLEELNLIGNRMTNVPDSLIFHSNLLITTILLSDNPWRCECKNNKFKILWEFLTSPPPKVNLNERNLLKCMSPNELEGKTWENACYFDFYPPSQNASFFDHYGVYLLIISLGICFVLVVCLSIKKRMKRRRKQRIQRLEAQRRMSRGSQDRLRRQSAASGDMVMNTNHLEVVVPLHDRVISQPPTYEEAVLLPRREASRADLQEPEPGPTPVGFLQEPTNDPGSTPDNSVDDYIVPPVPKITDDTDHDYEEVATDSEDDGDVEAGGSTTAEAQRQMPQDTDLDQAKLMSELRIELWSRENPSEQ